MGVPDPQDVDAPNVDIELTMLAEDQRVPGIAVELAPM
jgi:hypothetical protein